MRSAVTELSDRERRRIAVWIFLASGLVFLMLVIGGWTRLTGSGLSMVTWQPIIGIFPPTGESDWQTLFDQYRATPQFQKVNSTMDVHDFKSIFWLEYIHRLLGRLIGLVFVIPFGWFLWKRQLSRDLIRPLVTMFALGACQGLLGWYMVKSGLVDQPHVSPYRLTAHLMLAIAIHVYMIWVGLRVWPGGTAIEASPATRRWLILSLTFVAITIVSGGFVAGTKAGHMYNTFPWMGGRWVPETYWFLDPGWINLFENAPAVQFNHRWLAVVTGCIVALTVWMGRREPIRRWLWAAGFAASIQVGLGITTLLLHVPISLASLHQIGAFVLLTVLLIACQSAGIAERRELSDA